MSSSRAALLKDCPADPGSRLEKALAWAEVPDDSFNAILGVPNDDRVSAADSRVGEASVLVRDLFERPVDKRSPRWCHLLIPRFSVSNATKKPQEFTLVLCTDPRRVSELCSNVIETDAIAVGKVECSVATGVAERAKVFGNPTEAVLRALTKTIELFGFGALALCADGHASATEPNEFKRPLRPAKSERQGFAQGRPEWPLAMALLAFEGERFLDPFVVVATEEETTTLARDDRVRSLRAFLQRRIHTRDQRGRKSPEKTIKLGQAMSRASRQGDCGFALKLFAGESRNAAKDDAEALDATETFLRLRLVHLATSKRLPSKGQRQQQLRTEQRKGPPEKAVRVGDAVVIEL